MKMIPIIITLFLGSAAPRPASALAVTASTVLPDTDYISAIAFDPGQHAVMVGSSNGTVIAFLTGEVPGTRYFALNSPGSLTTGIFDYASSKAFFAGSSPDRILSVAMSPAGQLGS